ncbi:MAG: hypothetical protein P8K76_08025 [Candidatus Binatia bacterium]|nr:hypothetical protein [Candidatus Binatia bacterium]
MNERPSRPVERFRGTLRLGDHLLQPDRPEKARADDAEHLGILHAVLGSAI